MLGCGYFVQIRIALAPARKPYGIGLLCRCLKWIGVHTIPDSFCASTKTIPDRASVPMSSVDRCSYYTR